MNNEKEMEEFTFKVYVTGSFKTDEQKQRIKDIGDFIGALSTDKLKCLQLSGYVSGIEKEEAMNRIGQSDLIVVITDDMDSDSIFQIATAFTIGIPIVLFTESPGTKISEFVAFACSCFVNNDKSLLDIFISQGYKAKSDTYEDMKHINAIEDALQKEMNDYKELETSANKERSDKIKIFQAKQESLTKASQEAFDRSNVRIGEIKKYKTQTAFIGTIE